MKTKVDALMLRGELEYTLEDVGLRVKIGKGNITTYLIKVGLDPPMPKYS